jgi:hypothetical protein
MSNEPPVIVRAPSLADCGATFGDLLSLRAAPPLVISAGLVMLLTGSLALTVLTVLLTSYVHALWARMLTP